MIRDHQWLRTLGVLPRAGGKLDQDPRFIAAVEQIEEEKPQIERAVAEFRIKEREAQAANDAALGLTGGRR